MKNQYITDNSRQKYREIAHTERSLAFHASMKAVGYSVKYLFSQPERVIDAVSKKTPQLQKDCPAQ